MAWIRSLAKELPYATGVANKEKKEKRKERKSKKKEKEGYFREKPGIWTRSEKRKRTFQGTG